MFEKIERLFRCARRLRGNTSADREMLNALEDAAKSSLIESEALCGFRDLMIQLVMEIDGILFNFMLLWFLGGLCARETLSVELIDAKTQEQMANFTRRHCFREQVDEVLRGSTLIPAAMKILQSDFFIKSQSQETLYKQALDRYQERLQQPKFKSIVRELAFLEKYRSILPWSLHYIPVKLPDPEPEDMLELAEALNDKQNQLTMLCTPKASLTHLENFRLAHMHARLWLLRSDLPVCFACDVSYKDLRSGKVEPMIPVRANEPFPSFTETDHMQWTVLAYSWLKNTEEVYHMKHEDFLPSSRWSVPGHPVLVPRGNKLQSQSFLSWRIGLEDDESVKETVRGFEEQEPARVVAKLREFNAKSFREFGAFDLDVTSTRK